MNNFTRLLAFCSFFILIGHGYQYIFWDAPWRVLAWDQNLVEPFVIFVGGTWEGYASNLGTNHIIRQLSFFTGILMIYSAVSSLLLLRYKKKWLYFPIYMSSVFLFFHAFLEMKDNFYFAGQFFEHSIQVFIPIVFVFFMLGRVSETRLLGVLKFLLIVTFAAHGLYAVGYYPIPGYFIDMTILSIGVSENTAVWMLNVVGVLDLILVPLILYKPLTKLALVYALIWGVATAFARVFANFDFNFILPTLHQSVYLLIYRLPHGLIALVIWWLMKRKSLSKNTKY